MVLEVLGEGPHWALQEEFAVTGMGALSFTQMRYWISDGCIRTYRISTYRIGDAGRSYRLRPGIIVDRGLPVAPRRHFRARRPPSRISTVCGP